MTTTELIRPPRASGPPGGVSDAEAASFHTLRPRLVRIASRVLGNATEADDVVQDTWIRWQGTDRSQVRDATGFLVVTTTRLAMTVGRSAHVRRETSVDAGLGERVAVAADPSLGMERREALELAVQILLEKLSPVERAVYVLREAFDYPYRQIAGLLALSEANARQLVTRARRRLSGEHRREVPTDERQRLLDAFVAAAHTGAVAALEHLLVAEVAA
jgi:RNA polymerase sigma-70 factor (ECF subfamily)